ncbi:hypothetical protein GCM10025786_34050 [Nocardioides caeni]
MFVAVDRTPHVEVDHRLHRDLTSAEEVGDLFEEQWADALDPGNAVTLPGEDLGGDVDHDLGALAPPLRRTCFGFGLGVGFGVGGGAVEEAGCGVGGLP